MNFTEPTEYRCSCKKLLFKGFLLMSFIEVKCDRCGVVNIFKAKRNNEKLSFSFFVSSSEDIIRGCYATSIIGLPKKRFIGRHVENLFSYFRKTKKISNIKFFALPEYQFIENKINTWEDLLTVIKKNNSKKKISGYHLFGKTDLEKISDIVLN